MSGYSHKGQILPLVNQMIPIDKETTFHASYDAHLNGLSQSRTVSPFGNKTSYYFDGINGWVESKASVSSEEITIEFWIKGQMQTSYNSVFSVDDTTPIIHEVSGQITFRVPGVNNDYWGNHGASRSV